MTTENTLNGGKSPKSDPINGAGFSLQDLMDALADTSGDQRPVDRWNPDYCGEMDLVIKADGSWWHEGSRITRRGLIDLFASVLRKDEDGRTYLVTPVEKLGIQVERAPFLAIRVDATGEGEDQRLFFKTNLDETVEAGPDYPIRVETDAETMEPDPYVQVRGRLEAAINRAVFYELVELAVERDDTLGVWAGGAFFPLGPKGAHTA
ncbi:hypothetical protein GCM10007853_13660 [Algimonas ampicilliniresistens]|uniref:DUF1285 domain-containing protein n=1 Tax=Algimonas ampicilliniresistens TaxID=1298735 RepID=A0ABQ5V901_9PROT|nr:DUF1285 domain-containing protein [Algimonas ampicilliniresistens]GLQ23492.1 hypothetical protein GCM10007853_13660 [Algimonas ampicilliniresistens]